MYLEMEVDAPQGSPLHKVVEEHLTDSHRIGFNDPPPNNYAYISGWSFPPRNGYRGQEADPLYSALAMEMGFTPHSGSPHFSVHPVPDGGYRISGTLMYWRKTNSIHAWFVEKVQNGVDDCNRYEVSREKILELVALCEAISVDHMQARLLPPQAGFFFGSTEYDDWYFKDISDTAIELKTQLELAPAHARFYYQSSW